MRLTLPLAALGIAIVTLAAEASAQTVAVSYERAMEQEQAALAETPQSPEALRKVARVYESIVRRHPVSGYADNALWQAAGLFERAFTLTAFPSDRELATRFLTWLQKEYPHSPFAKQVNARLESLKATPAPLPAATPAPAAAVEPAPATGRTVSIRNITQSALPRGDRITIELSGEAAYSGERVANPDRIFFDFPNATTAGTVAERIRAIQSPLIKTIRVGSPVRGVARVVLELAGTPKFSSFPLYDPFRLVVDVESAAEPAPVVAQPEAAPAPKAVPDLPTPVPPASTRGGEYSMARQLGLRVSRVVIDAGHGGHDPGAQSNGVTEAELVLDVALRLERLLQQVPGVEVVLTRRTNEFIPLEERTAIANRERADLFLSIHANAHRQISVRGIETYFLNFATNDEAEAVAARENATSAQAMGTLPTILKAIALNNKLAESREFASLLQTALVRKLRAQSKAIRDLGVKQAPFVVLIGAQMPSVLTEIAFLTNRSEANLLKQSGYRQQIALALKEAVVRYQESLKKVVTVATREREQ